MKTKRINVREREGEASLYWPVGLCPKIQRNLSQSQGSGIEPTASSQKIVELNPPTQGQNGT